MIPNTGCCVSLFHLFIFFSPEYDGIPTVVCSVYAHGIASGTEQVLSKYLLNKSMIKV